MGKAEDAPLPREAGADGRWKHGRGPLRQPGPRTALPTPGMEVGGFLLEAELGRGGFSTVYLARRGGRCYALKLVALQGTEAWGERELQILSRLRHRGVVRMYGHGHWPDEEPQYLFLALEYVRGRSLETWVREENPSARRVASKLLCLSAALGAVHGAGVVHRDLKASNVLVREESSEPVLVDFGAGSYVGAPRVTASVLPPGTAAYRAPEAWRFYQQHLGSPRQRYPPVPADDLWALGVLLYWLLTDALPFDGLDEGELVHAILHEAPTPPHVLNPRVPRSLSLLCLRMLEKAPSARYPCAQALGAALEHALAHADGSWDIPLCDGWGPEDATTEEDPLLAPTQEDERWLRRWCHERPRRGLPPAPPPPPPMPLRSGLLPSVRSLLHAALQRWSPRQ